MEFLFSGSTTNYSFIVFTGVRKWSPPTALLTAPVPTAATSSSRSSSSSSSSSSNCSTDSGEASLQTSTKTIVDICENCGLQNRNEQLCLFNANLKTSNLPDFLVRVFFGCGSCASKQCCYPANRYMGCELRLTYPIGATFVSPYRTFNASSDFMQPSELVESNCFLGWHVRCNQVLICRDFRESIISSDPTSMLCTGPKP